MRFGDWSIPAKLVAVFSALVATIAATGVVVHFAVENHEQSADRTAHAHEILRAAGDAEYRLVRQENALRGYLLSGDAYYLRRLENVHRARFETQLAHLRRITAGDPELEAGVRRLTEAYGDYRRRVIEPVERLPSSGVARIEAAGLVRPDGLADRAIEPAEAALAVLTRQAEARAAREVGVQDRAAAVARSTLVAGVLFSALLTVLSALWLSRMIAQPVSRLSAAMDRVRSGEGFHPTGATARGDEIGRLTRAFDAMVVDLDRRQVSLRQAMEDLTVARDRAEAASVAKSRFLANMSHEIRTPLNGVLGMVQAIEMDQLSPRQRERVGLVKTSGVALLALVNDVLDLAKVEAGRTDLTIEPFELLDLLEEVRGTFQPLAEAKALALVVQIAPDAAGAWVGDRARLRQILSNLVANAVKFTDHGAVFIDGGAGGDGLRLVVRDTGIGIPFDRQAELFQKFTQLDSSPTRRHGGAGLGLAICRELSALMGGSIGVDSVEGQGARFEVRLPLSRAAASVAA
ncbi:ATP-binding protein [Caulobacter mirabilis]|nr:ATP-binding protein [Caulobacter mirabilis]